MKYDYKEEIKKDIKGELAEFAEYHNIDISDIEFDDVYDELFVSDSVTGNASGSYTCNTWEAAEHLLHNEDLLIEALEEFGGDYKEAIESPEYSDVTIRCYLLADCLSEVLDESKSEE